MFIRGNAEPGVTVTSAKTKLLPPVVIVGKSPREIDVANEQLAKVHAHQELGIALGFLGTIHE